LIWRQYESEIGLPWESVEPYLEMSYPFLHADRIKTPTMFMCGEMDFNVPLINSEQMYQALRSLNVPTQLVIYPGQNHGLAKPSYNQDRLERMIRLVWPLHGQTIKTGSEPETLDTVIARSVATRRSSFPPALATDQMDCVAALAMTGCF
jgi:acetyl esterase/lipase